VVPNLDDAVAYIDARVDVWYREQLFDESERAKEMLTKYRPEIVEQINQIRELTEFDLGVHSFSGILGGTKALEAGESLEQVNSLNLDEIESAVWKDKDKPQSRILFRLRCIANATTTSSSVLTSPFAPRPRYVVGGEKPVFPTFLNAYAFSPQQKRERTLPVWLYGEAHFERVNGDWRLSSVRVDKSQPGPEEMAALVNVRQRKA
jgi:hypothetical protein